TFLDPSDFASTPWVLEQWFSMNTLTYVEVAQPSDVESMQSEMKQWIDLTFPPLPFGRGSVKTSDVAELILFNIQDIHLRSSAHGNRESEGDIVQIYVLIAIAALIVAIATINFV